MKFSDINPSSVLKTVLVTAGMTETIYADGEKPTSGLPAKYIEILNNGYVSSNSSQFGLYQQTLIVSINVRLSPLGTRDIVSEKTIMAKLDNILLSPVVSEKYSFSMSKTSMFGGSRNLISGYSTKLINIVSTIQN